MYIFEIQPSPSTKLRQLLWNKTLFYLKLQTFQHCTECKYIFGCVLQWRFTFIVANKRFTMCILFCISNRRKNPTASTELIQCDICTYSVLAHNISYTWTPNTAHCTLPVNTEHMTCYAVFGECYTQIVTWQVTLSSFALPISFDFPRNPCTMCTVFPLQLH